MCPFPSLSSSACLNVLQAHTKFTPFLRIFVFLFSIFILPLSYPPLLDLFLKGGGGCHVQEKIIASNAKSFVVVADDRKISPLLGTNWNKGIPIEAIPANYVPLLKKLTDLGGKPVLRMAKSKAGPVVSDNGNFIIDVDFGPLDGKNSPALMEQRLRMLTGVVDVGLFVGMASKAYFGHRDGSMSFRSVNTS
eukprot:m.213734 g.213734  ORF g.213734 m.213734 type:complete len:192 (+) comp26177_c0_seq5:48-623(+)